MSTLRIVHTYLANKLKIKGNKDHIMAFTIMHEQKVKRDPVF